MQATGGGITYPTALVVDATGTATLAGLTAGPANFGGLPVINANPTFDTGIFVARLSSTGQWTQVVVAGGTETNYPVNLAVDGAGTATLAGTFRLASLPFGPFVLRNASTRAADNDVFVAASTRPAPGCRPWRPAGRATTFCGPSPPTPRAPPRWRAALWELP